VTRHRAALGSTAVIRLAAGRELGQRLRARSFWAFTAVLVVAILAIGVISRLAADDGPAAIEIGVTEPASEDLGVALTRTAELVGLEVTVTAFPDAASARSALQDETVDVLVVQGDGQIRFAHSVDNQLVSVVQQAWAGVETQRALADAGLTPDQTAQALATTPLEVISLDGDGESSGLALLTGTLAGVLLFIALQTFGTYVLTGVVEEKATAVVEVLLVRARADHLLAGKVIGIGVAGLLQFALAVAAGMGALAISGTDVPQEIWAALPMTLVWFLGGYALYSTLFAVAGSLVSRQEDAGAASAPVLTVLIGSYMLIFLLGFTPDSTASTLLSLLPPIAPLLMPMRMAAGAASGIEVAVALMLLLAATWAAWKLASRIYEQVLLHRGSRISWRQALALARPGGVA